MINSHTINTHAHENTSNKFLRMWVKGLFILKTYRELLKPKNGIRHATPVEL